jgi:hypothetical protein
MKKSIVSAVISLTILLGVGSIALNTANAQGVTLQQIVQLFIQLGIIPADKVAAAEAAVGLPTTGTVTTTNTTITSVSPNSGTTQTNLPTIVSVNPQPVQVGSSFTVYFSNGGNAGSVILKTLDGSKSWSVPYTTGTVYNGYVYYDGSKVTFTIPSMIGRGELPENTGYEAPIAITSGTYNLYVYSVGIINSSGTVTQSGGTSAAFPITINTVASETTYTSPTVATPPIAVMCVGANSSPTGVTWTALPSGGSGSYNYSWSVYNDVTAYGSGSTQSSSFGVTYGSSGTKQAVVRVSDADGNPGVVSASCQTVVNGTYTSPTTVTPSITVTSPSGDSYTPGSDVSVTWNESGFTPSDIVITLGGSDIPEAITSLANLGASSQTSYNITIPSNAPTGVSAAISVCNSPSVGMPVCGNSPYFTITAPTAPTPSTTQQPFSISCLGTPSGNDITWSSSASGGSQIPVSYSWNVYNDLTSYVSGSPSVAAFTAAYGSAGTKSVTVQSTDSLGHSASGSCSATITAPSTPTPMQSEQATIDNSTFSQLTSTPTVSGTASGVSWVGVVLGGSGGDKAYGSGLIPVTNGRWSVTVSPALSAGVYSVYVYDSNNTQLATGGYITVPTPTPPPPTPVPGVESVIPSATSINSGGRVTLNFTVPANVVDEKLYLVCPSAITTVGGGLCNTYDDLRTSTEVDFTPINSSTAPQTIVPNFYIYLSSNPSAAVGVSSSITVGPSTAGQSSAVYFSVQELARLIQSLK